MSVLQFLVLKLLRALRVFIHLAEGALTILLLFSLLNRTQRDRRVVGWSSRLIRILGLDLAITGAIPPRAKHLGAEKGVLVTANHISWLDIYVLHSCLQTRFISKSEVRNWPLTGWMAARSGTLFLERQSKRDAARMNQTMSALLKSGECLALFPEGTTTDGSHVLPFYASLLQPAIDADVWIQPVAIRYLDADGKPSQAAAYHGDISLLESLRSILAARKIRVHVHFLPATPTGGRLRRELAREVENAIRSALAGDAPDNPPGTPAHPPA